MMHYWRTKVHRRGRYAARQALGHSKLSVTDIHTSDFQADTYTIRTQSSVEDRLAPKIGAAYEPQRVMVREYDALLEADGLEVIPDGSPSGLARNLNLLRTREGILGLLGGPS